MGSRESRSFRTGFSILYRWVAANPVLFAQAFPLGCAVNVGNKRCWRVLEVSDQPVPVGLQLLAMASPWSEKLHEHLFPCSLRVPVCLCQLKSSRRKRAKREDTADQLCERCHC